MTGMKKLLQIIRFINGHPLARRHKLKAYWRFLYWQISQSIYPHELIYSFVGGTKLVVKKGLTGATGNIYTGLHEFSDMGFLIHFLRKDDLFFDIGANVGSYTVLAGGYSGARTVAIEPIPKTFSWLIRNLAVNNLQQKVKPKNIGMGSQKGKLHFTAAYDTVNHVLSKDEISRGEYAVDVQIETFDSISSAEGIPGLVKIDVEGYETEVLKGMENSLKSDLLKAIIIELNGSGMRYGYEESWIDKCLRENNYKPYQYDPFSRILQEVEHFGSHNTIYIRDIDFVKDRLANAEKLTVFSENF